MTVDITDLFRGATVEGVEDKYAPDYDERPLRGQATLTGIFAAAVTALVALARRRRVELAAKDVVALGVATELVARVATRSAATAFLRAPFTRLVDGADGEVREEPRGAGLRRAVGELVTCTSCVAPWVAAALTAAFVARPKETRIVASIFAIAGIARRLARAR
jgi:hypothetical protein